MKCFNWSGYKFSLFCVSAMNISVIMLSVLITLFTSDIIKGFETEMLVVMYVVILVELLVVYVVRRSLIVYLNPDTDTLNKSQVIECIRSGEGMYASSTKNLNFMRKKIIFLNKDEYKLVRRAVAKVESNKVKYSITRHSLHK